MRYKNVRLRLLAQHSLSCPDRFAEKTVFPTTDMHHLFDLQQWKPVSSAAFEQHQPCLTHCSQPPWVYLGERMPMLLPLWQIHGASLHAFPCCLPHIQPKYGIHLRCLKHHAKHTTLSLPRLLTSLQHRNLHCILLYDTLALVQFIY